MSVQKIENLIDLYGKDVYAFCMKLTANRNDADDLYQQTFLLALNLSERIDIENNPKSYLLSIAVNEWKNYTRKRSRREKIAPSVSLDILNDEAEKIGDDSDTADIAERNVLLREVRNQINLLPEKLKIPTLLYYMNDYGIDAIANICQCPAGTVKSRLFKARKKIKEGLEVLGYDGYE